MPMTDLTLARLQAVLDYNPDTGVFTWKMRLSNRITVGASAGSLDRDGYFIISIDGTRYFAHRLAWLYMTSAWPKDDIDHINGSPSDNRWENLRAATRSQNLANTSRFRNNTTGFKGVTRIKNGKYVAQIKVKQQRIYLGCFTFPEDAHTAYVIAARGYFGEFARR